MKVGEEAEDPGLGFSLQLCFIAPLRRFPNGKFQCDETVPPPPPRTLIDSSVSRKLAN